MYRMRHTAVRLYTFFLLDQIGIERCRDQQPSSLGRGGLENGKLEDRLLRVIKHSAAAALESSSYNPFSKRVAVLCNADNAKILDVSTRKNTAQHQNIFGK